MYTRLPLSIAIPIYYMQTLQDKYLHSLQTNTGQIGRRDACTCITPQHRHAPQNEHHPCRFYAGIQTLSHGHQENLLWLSYNRPSTVRLTPLFNWQYPGSVHVSHLPNRDVTAIHGSDGTGHWRHKFVLTSVTSHQVQYFRWQGGPCTCSPFRVWNKKIKKSSADSHG